MNALVVIAVVLVGAETGVPKMIENAVSEWTSHMQGGRWFKLTERSKNFCGLSLCSSLGK